MASDYLLYGLTLRSNRLLPHLVPAPTAPAPRPVDAYLTVGGEPSLVIPHADEIAWTASPVDGRLAPGRSVWAGTTSGGQAFVRLRYEDDESALEFVIEPDGRRVWSGWADSSAVKSRDDVTAFLAGPVCACLLRMRGRIGLHACVVAPGDRAVVILAAPGTGKSTIAAAFAQQGHAVLSDDVAAITPPDSSGDGRWIASPGYPRLRLRPETLDTFSGAPIAQRPVITGTAKRYLRLRTEPAAGAWRFRQEPLPVDVVYLLERSPDADAPAIDPIPGNARLTTLLRHTAAGFIPIGSPGRAEEFARLGRLAAGVPIRRAQVPEGLERLPDVCAAISTDAASHALTPV